MYISGCPIRTHVHESYQPAERATSLYGVQGVSGRGITSVPVSQQAYFFIDMHGSNWKLSDVEVDVRGFPSVPSSAISRSPSTRSNMTNNNLTVPLTRAGRPGSGAQRASGSGGSAGGGGYETDDSVFARGENKRDASPAHGGGVCHGYVLYSFIS